MNLRPKFTRFATVALVALGFFLPPTAWAQHSCNEVFLGTSSIAEAKVSSNASLWSRILRPVGRHDPRNYNYLVHAIRNTALLDRVGPDREISGSVPYLFSALISQANNHTIWGSPGLILESSVENIVIASRSDTHGKIRDQLIEARRTGNLASLMARLRMENPLPAPETLGAETPRIDWPWSGYNEILVKNEANGPGRIKVAGFFYYIDAEGNPLLHTGKQAEIYEAMKSLAARLDVPMIGLEPSTRPRLSPMLQRVESWFSSFGGTFLRSHPER